MFKKCLNLSFFERSFPAKNWKPYPIFFQHLVLPIKTGYKEPYEETFNLLDEIEYLPVLMLDEKDRTQEFEEYLKGICEKYSFMPIWYRYQKGENI